MQLKAWLAVLAGVKSLASSTILLGVLGPKWGAVFFAVSTALDVSTAAWVLAIKPPPTRRRKQIYPVQ
jgi:O-antigen/teichoic acid export membrane protein